MGLFGVDLVCLITIVNVNVLIGVTNRPTYRPIIAPLLTCLHPTLLAWLPGVFARATLAGTAYRPYPIHTALRIGTRPI